MNQGEPLYVLDSFALLAFFQNEPGAAAVEQLLERARRGEVRLAMAVVNLGEVYYRTIREHGQARADEVIGLTIRYPIEMNDVGTSLALEGAQLKGIHKMSYADCIGAALSLRLDAIFVTGDPEFKLVDGLIKIEWLPQR